MLGICPLFHSPSQACGERVEFKYLKITVNTHSTCFRMSKDNLAQIANHGDRELYENWDLPGNRKNFRAYILYLPLLPSDKKNLGCEI